MSTMLPLEDRKVPGRQSRQACVGQLRWL